MSRTERHHLRQETTARPTAASPLTDLAPAPFGELVERARLLAEQGWQQALELRERVEAAPLARAVRQGLEGSGERLAQGRDRVGRQVRGLRAELRRWREGALHGLGLATRADLDRMARQLRALRSQLRRGEHTAGELGRPATA